MARICYIKKRLTPDKIEMIVKVNEIIDDFTRQGFSLTLRQLYYQLVGHDLFPDSRKYVNVDKKWILHPEGTKNAVPNYDWLGEIVGDARLAGLIDWDSIVDRTRNLRALRHHAHPRDPITEASESFHFWKWEDQPNYVEVWVEKDAMLDIVGQACNALDTPFFSCRGYTSISELHGAAMRFQHESREHGKTCRVIHLGDHDPSGLDMTRNIKERINETFGVDFKVHRVALNLDQIERYQPPPNPAKDTDARFKKYQEQHGDSSWELDALSPGVITNIITKNIEHWLDMDKWRKNVAREERARDVLKSISTRWNEVYKLVRNAPEEPIE